MSPPTKTAGVGVILLVVAAVSLSAPPAGAPTAPTPTAAVQVTTNPAPVRAHSSPQLARNPGTGELVVAEVDVRGTRRCAVHISADGGRSWFLGGDPMVDPYTDCSIGAEWGTYFNVFFDTRGTLYLPFAANDPAAFDRSADASSLRQGRDRKYVPRNLYLARSTDGGRSFSTTTVYEAPAGNPAVGYAYGVMGAVDPSDPERVYVTWAQGDFLDLGDKTSAVVASSTDGGKTFAAPVDMTDERGSEQAWLAVDGQGTLHAAWWSLAFDEGRTIFQRGPEDDPLPMVYGRSTDGGATWSHADIDPGNQEYTRHPVLVADSRSSALYAVWFANPEADNLPLKEEGRDLADVFVRASTDGGLTWGDRRTVNDDPANQAGQAHPGASLSPGGRLDIAWYDDRSSPGAGPSDPGDAGLQDVYYASSKDRGASFGPNQRISDRSIDRSIGVWSNNVGSAAPVGIASDDGVVSFAWQDTRAGNELDQAEDVYFASLHLDGTTTTEDQAAVPAWLSVAAGLALGLGLAAALGWAYLAGRRQEATAASR